MIEQNWMVGGKKELAKIPQEEPNPPPSKKQMLNGLGMLKKCHIFIQIVLDGSAAACVFPTKVSIWERIWNRSRRQRFHFQIHSHKHVLLLLPFNQHLPAPIPCQHHLLVSTQSIASYFIYFILTFCLSDSSMHDPLQIIEETGLSSSWNPLQRSSEDNSAERSSLCQDLWNIYLNQRTDWIDWELQRKGVRLRMRERETRRGLERDR